MCVKKALDVLLVRRHHWLHLCVCVRVCVQTGVQHTYMLGWLVDGLQRLLPEL